MLSINSAVGCKMCADSKMVKMLCVWFDLKTQFARLLLSATWERKAKRTNQKQRKRNEKPEHECAWLLSCHTNRIESANACRAFYGTVIVHFTIVWIFALRCIVISIARCNGWFHDISSWYKNYLCNCHSLMDCHWWSLCVVIRWKWLHKLCAYKEYAFFY